MSTSIFEKIHNISKIAGTEMQIASLTSALNFYRAPFAHAFETAAKKLDKKRMEFLQNLPFVKKNEKNVVEEEQTAPVTTPEKIQAKKKT